MELVVSLAVGAVVLSVVMGIVIVQQRAQESADVMRVAVASSRGAMVELERSLRRAGYGVDPRHAFDFRYFRCDADDQIPAEEGRTACRDRRNDSDRLSFVARAPGYRVDSVGENGCLDALGCPSGQAWRLLAYDSSAPSISVNARQNQVFRKGQTLLAVCHGASSHTMMTVRDTAVAAADGPLELTLGAPVAGNPYFENDLGRACYTGGANVFLVQRFHYFVQDYDGVPWLVMDTGLDLDGDDLDPWTTRDPDDLVPIAPNVEDLQVAYVLERHVGAGGPDSDANGVVGDNAADGALAEEPDHFAAAPGYQTKEDAPERRNLHPANIRAVRVTVTVRSERPDPAGGPGWAGDVLVRPENSERILSVEQLGRFRRHTAASSVAVRNLGSRGMFSF